MLDPVDYCIEEDLTRASLLEPSCGQGDLLFVAVQSLLDSTQRHHGSLTDVITLLLNALRAVELHEETFSTLQHALLFLSRNVVSSHRRHATWLTPDSPR